MRPYLPKCKTYDNFESRFGKLSTSLFSTEHDLGMFEVRKTPKSCFE